MNISMRTLLLLVCLCTLVSACQTFDGNASGIDNPDANTVDLKTTAQRLGEADPDRSVSMPADATSAARNVTVGEVYTAASGRLCKRLFDENRQALQRVVCKTKGEQWKLQRSLSSDNTNAAIVVPASYQEVLVVSEAPVELLKKTTTSVTATSVTRVRQATETLWSFSQRVTGNGANWQAIAEINEIDDARKLPSDLVLNVPASLVLDERHDGLAEQPGLRGR